jgi:hypothetical protein
MGVAVQPDLVPGGDDLPDALRVAFDKRPGAKKVAPRL